MKLLFGHDAQIGAFVAERLGISIPPPFVALGIVDEGGLLRGGVVYNNFNGSNIEVSYVGPDTLTRSIIRGVFYAYPFEQAGVLRLTAATKRSNKLVCRLLPRLGFRHEATLKNYFGPTKADDAIVYRLVKADAERWNKRASP